MIRVLKAKEMAFADENTINVTGIPSLVLMENAGRTSAQIVLEIYKDKRDFTVVAGTGNNGGDGLVVARYLLKKGKNVKVLILADSRKKLSEDNKKNLEVFEIMGGKVLFISEEKLSRLRNEIKQSDVVIDSIFGTGFSPPVKGYREKAIEIINKYAKSIVSIDLPSGLSADTGKIDGKHIKADITITFAYPKLCHILYPASKFCGKIFIVDISIDDKYVQQVERFIIKPSKISLPQRDKDSHKYTYGHVLVVGGSRGKTGAVIMSCKSATVSGAGLVTAIIPESLDFIFETSLIEEMTIPVDDDNGYFGKNAFSQIKDILSKGKFSSIVAGMGMSVTKYTLKLIEELIKIDKPIVLDADGLNNLSRISSFERLLLRRKAPTILTPHIGEMARLTGYDKSFIQENMEDVAKEFSKKTKSYVVLKSSRTVIATPDGRIFYSILGNEGMATAGTGDVLAGILGALINRLTVEDAVITGVTLHGISGDLAVKHTGKESLKATDIIKFIPQGYKVLETIKENEIKNTFYEPL